MDSSRRLIICITGASGAAYGKRALEITKECGVETFLVISRAGETTLRYEMDLGAADLAPLCSDIFKIGDIAAPIASGSFSTMGMLIAPCSVNTMSQIASGVTGNLISRAADVVLKERRRLVMMVRESPFHLGHLRTMTQLTEMGAIIAPPLPAFYAEPMTIDDMITQSVCRSLDLFGLHPTGMRRWGEDLEKGKRGS